MTAGCGEPREPLYPQHRGVRASQSPAQTKTYLALVRVAHSSHKATKRSNFSFSLWLRVLSDWKERARDRFYGFRPSFSLPKDRVN